MFPLNDEDLARVEKNLFISGADTFRIKLAELDKNKIETHMDVIKEVFRFIWTRGIDVAMFDPLISMHKVNESDNAHMEAIVSILRVIAEMCNCAIGIIHHSRKMSAGNSNQELMMEDARGASALLGAVRIGRTMQRIATKAVAKKLGLDWDSCKGQGLVVIKPGKANYSVLGVSNFRKMVSVDLDNANDRLRSDFLGVFELYMPSKIKDGASDLQIDAALDLIVAGVGGDKAKFFQRGHKSDAWVGKPIAEVLKLDPRKDRGNIEGAIDSWIADGYLEVFVDKDAKSARQGFRAGDRPAGGQTGADSFENEDDKDAAAAEEEEKPDLMLSETRGPR